MGASCEELEKSSSASLSLLTCDPICAPTPFARRFNEPSSLDIEGRLIRCSWQKEQMAEKTKRQVGEGRRMRSPHR